MIKGSDKRFFNLVLSSIYNIQFDIHYYSLIRYKLNMKACNNKSSPVLVTLSDILLLEGQITAESMFLMVASIGDKKLQLGKGKYA